MDPGIPVVSSIFFMCLPDKVLVYGDCAINTNPNADELASIAIASADSAKAFGLEPRVAMLSYATGDSNQGALGTGSPSCRRTVLSMFHRTEAADLVSFGCLISLQDRRESYAGANGNGAVLRSGLSCLLYAMQGQVHT
jgi:hypothetical protein